MERIFREDHEIHRRKIAARLADHIDDALGLVREILLGCDHRQLQLHEPDHDAFGRFVQSAKSVHVPLPGEHRFTQQSRFLRTTKAYISGNWPPDLKAGVRPARRAFVGKASRYDGTQEIPDMRLIARGEISNVSNGG